MEALLQSDPTKSWRECLIEIEGQPLFKPFDPLLIEFISQLSKKLLSEENMRPFPEIIALGHWLRKSQLLKFEEKFKFYQKELLPRGTVLHFAPANIDSSFIYSWIVSLLVGNRNVIRLTSNLTPQIVHLIEILRGIFDVQKFLPIKKSTLIMTYEHDEQITKELSTHCHVRMIWGGDETIQRIRTIPIPPYAIELIFADRFSFGVFNAKFIQEATDEVIDQLVKRFYMDVWWYNQATCSSPRCVIWIGSGDILSQAKERFWKCYQQYQSSEHPEDREQNKMYQLTSAFLYAAMKKITHLEGGLGGPVCRLQIENIDKESRRLHFGGGVFLEMQREKLSDLHEAFIVKDQTIGSIGFTSKEWREFLANLPGRSIDRIVPIGQMLHFNPVWDGYNLFLSLTREVTVFE